MATTPRTHNTRAVLLRVAPLAASSGGYGDTTGDTITLGASQNFVPIFAGEMIGAYAMHFIVGAGLTGTFSVQGSLVPDPELTTDADWVTLSPTVLGAALAYAGAAGSTIAYGVDQLYEWVRLKYTHTSGAATFRGFARADWSH